MFLDRLRVDHREGHARSADAQSARRYPTYRWEHNVGYATQDHIAGLAMAGITPHHRRSFMRIRQLSFDFDAMPEIVVDIPVEALVEDLDTDVSSMSALDLAPNDAIAADQLRG